MATLMLSEPQTGVRAIPLPNLLVIDDDPVNRELMRRLFESEYCVASAGSGKAGFDALTHTEFDVVLLDVMMPDMNGFDVLKQIRSTPNTADLPVILISSLTDSDYVVQGLQAGANDYLTKPVNPHVARARLGTQVKLKRLLDEQKRAIIQLEELNTLREHFFRIASHDLKNPLANLRLAHYELSYFVPDNDDTAVLRDTIDTSMSYMQSLIEDFLDAAALQNGKLDVDIDTVDLNQCLTAVFEQYSITADNKEIALRVTNANAQVAADRQRLIQVIGNLVSNAIKYSPPSTTVTVWTEVTGGRARIYVSDEGPGIPPEEHARLFKEFSKLSTRPTNGESSNGLGLWIVQHLMQLMNGAVGINSRIGAGSTFWLELPIA
jgi:two-component system, sensor histidine kinase and response regulator